MKIVNFLLFIFFFCWILFATIIGGWLIKENNLLLNFDNKSKNRLYLILLELFDRREWGKKRGLYELYQWGDEVNGAGDAAGDIHHPL